MSSTSDPLALENGARRRGLALMLVVFVLGMVCGAALSVILIRGVGPLPPRRVPSVGAFGGGHHGFERMAERLDLTDEQRRRIQEELAATSQAVHRLLDGSGERIRELLDEEQRRTFDEMRPHGGRHRRRPAPGTLREAPPGTAAPAH